MGTAAFNPSVTWPHTLQNRASHHVPCALLSSCGNWRGRDASEVDFSLFSILSDHLGLECLRRPAQLMMETRQKPRMSLTQVRDTVFKDRPFQILVVLLPLSLQFPFLLIFCMISMQTRSYFCTHPTPSCHVAVFLLFPRVLRTRDWRSSDAQNIISKHS